MVENMVVGNHLPRIGIIKMLPICGSRWNLSWMQSTGMVGMVTKNDDEENQNINVKHHGKHYIIICQIRMSFETVGSREKDESATWIFLNT